MKLCSKCRENPIARGSKSYCRGCLNEWGRLNRAKQKDRLAPSPMEVLAYRRVW